MISSPARAVLPLQGTTSAHSPRGGTLAQPQAISRLGHSLFRQAAQQRVTDFPDPNEAACRVMAATWRARRQNRRVSLPAESRPFVFPQINNIAHRHLLADGQTTGTAIPSDGRVIRGVRNGQDR